MKKSRYPGGLYWKHPNLQDWLDPTYFRGGSVTMGEVRKIQIETEPGLTSFLLERPGKPPFLLNTLRHWEMLIPNSGLRKFCWTVPLPGNENIFLTRNQTIDLLNHLRLPLGVANKISLGKMLTKHIHTKLHVGTQTVTSTRKFKSTLGYNVERKDVVFVVGLLKNPTVIARVYFEKVKGRIVATWNNTAGVRLLSLDNVIDFQGANVPKALIAGRPLQETRNAFNALGLGKHVLDQAIASSFP